MPPTSRSSGWLGKGLVSAQIALALILLITTGLMVRAYARALSAPFGFDGTNVLSIDLRTPSYKEVYRDYRSGTGEASRARFYDSALEQLARVPGVLGAAFGPFRGMGSEQISVDQQGKPIYVQSGVATPDYFRVFGLRLLAGRLFQSTDSADAPRVAVVNQSLAQELWPGSNPIGKRIFRIKHGKSAGVAQVQIVGLIGDHQFGEHPPDPTVFFARSQKDDIPYSYEMLVRTKASPLSLVPQLRKALQMVDRDAPLGKVVSVEQLFHDGRAFRRFSLLLILIFAGLAFSLATIGIYGTIAYSVSRRTHEIGIRMALGAQRRDVLILVVRQAIGMLLIGEAVGLAGASAANRLMSRMFVGFFGITAGDTATCIAVLSTVAAVAILATYLPARKATAIDPLRALRCE